MHPIISITLFTTAAAAVVGLGLAAAPTLTPPGRDASTMTISETDRRISASGHDVTPLSRDEVERLASKLTPEQYRITQKAGTEPAFCGTLLDNKKEGMYVCVVCGLPLFKSEHKFTSGTGWPSFFTPFDADHVTEKTDESFGMVRVEIECARCGSHLGHVFPDGPPPTGQRYCLNSEALAFVEKGEEVPVESRPLALETAYFAGGCFWGVELAYQREPGVVGTKVRCPLRSNAAPNQLRGRLMFGPRLDAGGLRTGRDGEPHIRAGVLRCDGAHGGGAGGLRPEGGEL